MKFGSLFSGIGGFDLAFERAGMQCAWQCEIDKNCQKLLSNKFNARIFEDVRNITRNNAEPVDVICGGFPCQDVSVAGKRTGLAGERSGLWFEFQRILSELRPQWAIIENVPGLLSSARGRDFAVILQGLGELGYLTCWRVLDAQYFGVAQRRRRVFLIASLGDGRSAEVLFEREGVRWDTTPRREVGKEVAYSLRANPSHSGDKGDGGINTTLVSDITIPLVMAHGQANAEITEDMTPTLNASHEQPIVILNDQGDAQMSISENVTATLRSQEHGHQPVILDMQLASEAYRESGSISPTLQSRMGTGGNNVPIVGVRRLTPTECERLQGFPDGWTEGFADNTRYKMLGNAVAVPVVEWIGRRVVMVSEGEQ